MSLCGWFNYAWKIWVDAKALFGTLLSLLTYIDPSKVSP